MYILVHLTQNLYILVHLTQNMYILVHLTKSSCCEISFVYSNCMKSEDKCNHTKIIFYSNVLIKYFVLAMCITQIRTRSSYICDMYSGRGSEILQTNAGHP